MENGEEIMNQAKSYVRFTSSEPQFDFEFLYPADWQPREIVEKDYAEVSFVGPRNTEDTFSLDLTVRVTASHDQVEPSSLVQQVAEHLTKSRHLPNFQELGRVDGYLSGVAASEVEYAYSLPLPLNTVNARETRIVEHRIFLQRDSRLYEIIYGGSQQEYDKYLNILKDVVRTFEFRDDESQHPSRVLVMPAPIPAAREPPAE
jgi:hypothetical protein